MVEVLERRCAGLEAGAELFRGVSAEHVHMHGDAPGWPRFMLHDLRKLVATTGERLVQIEIETALDRLIA